MAKYESIFIRHWVYTPSNFKGTSDDYLVAENKLDESYPQPDNGTQPDVNIAKLLRKECDYN